MNKEQADWAGVVTRGESRRTIQNRLTELEKQKKGLQEQLSQAADKLQVVAHMVEDMDNRLKQAEQYISSKWW